ncbi:MAG: tRNA (guanosine(46)-N7)-methyltransferase TrmB [Anaerolineae bacterium]|nr:tRNA (guanosine(46)-N7)-methyltransferase TrmB [Anaerolineae bacterium]MDW8173442.1 tRNA (guanosine(46)-N7)-methyltransferase TrmB [Anaerolineae bacterium]
MTAIWPKLSWYHLPFPTDWAQVFDADRPLIVEIGFGNGHYLVALAQQHPDCNVLGVEISGQALSKAEDKLARAGLRNARVLYCRAETLLHHLLPPSSVHEFHINYPDPWFKSRHAGRRLMQRDTLDALASRLVVGGKLYLATDISAYAEMSHELLSQTPSLSNCLSAPWLDRPPTERLLTTKYEARGYEQGRHGHYFIYRRNHQPAPNVPLRKEWPMPHVILYTPHSSSEIAAAFSKQVFQRGEATAAVLDAYVSRRSSTLLFEATLDEPTIQQHVAIVLLPRQTPHEYTLKFGTLGYPRMTEGLHLLTHELARWIVSLHPEARILDAHVREV